MPTLTPAKYSPKHSRASTHPARRRRAKLLWLFFPALALIYSELVLKLWCFRALTLRGVYLTVLLSGAAGLFLAFLFSLALRRFYRAAVGLLLWLVFLLFSTQSVYYCIFKSFLLVSYLDEAGMALSSFWREALVGIGRTSPAILLFALPPVLWCIFSRRLVPTQKKRRDTLLPLAFFAAVKALALALILCSSGGIMNARYLYTQAFLPEMSMRYFGAVTTLNLDVKNLLAPDSAAAAPAATTAPTPSPTPTAQSAPAAETPQATATPEPVDRSAQVLDIDFSAHAQSAASSTVAALDEYFAAAEPSCKNEYTGLFEGYNLIVICAEGFSGYVLDSGKLPTVSKLASEGFVFTNFYNPYWYFSTADGEFTLQNSLIPMAGSKSVYTAMYNTMPFGLGNILNPLGYHSWGFHNHNGAYYSRNISMPNLGYEFRALNYGLDVTEYWPESDTEMVELSTDLYINDEPFNVYMMTVSGHMNYNFYGNQMAARHEDEVADLTGTYSETVRAYIACQMEMDQAVQQLLDRLEEAGVLDRTVIVLTGDHYPYDLDPVYSYGATGLGELMGTGTVDALEKFRSSLVIWNSALAKENQIEVDTLCCQMDILPTVLNLLGVDYDSRLIMGRDIFSEGTERLVVFSDQSFISDYGRYNASTDTFTANDGAFASESEANAYAADTLTRVSQMFSVSANVLHTDYYAALDETQ